MMKIRSFLVLSVLSFAAIGVPVHSGFAADRYVADVVHSNVIFNVGHSGISKVFGRFNDFNADILWDQKDPAKSSVAFTIQTASVDTNNEKRDEHLRSPDFFNTAQFPEISFKSKKIEKADDDSFRVSGDVTMLGETKPVSFVWKETGAGENARGEFRKGGISTFTVKRSDFGMNFMIGPVSDEIEMTISLQTVRQ